MQQSPIFTKTYDMVKWLLEHTAKFPKAQRFVMAKRLEETALLFYELLIEAGKTDNKRPTLVKADIELEKLRLHLRLCKDLQLLTFKQYDYLSVQALETGKLLGAWIKKG